MLLHCIHLNLRRKMRCDTAYLQHCHRRQNSSPGIYLLSPGLLQLHAVRHDRLPSAEGSVHSECHCMSGNRSSTIRPHHASAVSAALAACMSRSRVQGCMPGTPVSGWSDTRIHNRRHPTRYGQWSPSATFCRCQDMPRSRDAQQLPRSKLQSCSPRMWNSLPPHLRRDMHELWQSSLADETASSRHSKWMKSTNHDSGTRVVSTDVSVSSNFITCHLFKVVGVESTTHHQLTMANTHPHTQTVPQLRRYSAWTVNITTIASCRGISANL